LLAFVNLNGGVPRFISTYEVNSYFGVLHIFSKEAEIVLYDDAFALSGTVS